MICFPHILGNVEACLWHGQLSGGCRLRWFVADVELCIYAFLKVFSDCSSDGKYLEYGRRGDWRSEWAREGGGWTEM